MRPETYRMDGLHLDPPPKGALTGLLLQVAAANSLIFMLGLFTGWVIK